MMRVLLHKFSSQIDAATDDDLHIHAVLPWVCRGRCRARLSSGERRLLVLLAANMGRTVSLAAIVDALFHDDVDGGPEGAMGTIRNMVEALRTAAPGLGFKIVSAHSVGYRLELLGGGAG